MGTLMRMVIHVSNIAVHHTYALHSAATDPTSRILQCDAKVSRTAGGPIVRSRSQYDADSFLPTIRGPDGLHHGIFLGRHRTGAALAKETRVPASCLSGGSRRC